MVSQMTPEEYFSKKGEIKKSEEEKKEKAKKVEEERQKAKLILKPGEKPMIVPLPPIKIVINLDKCPHCGLKVSASSEFEEEVEKNAT